ncbi:amino acid ABC transporter permease [Streptomyces sp. NPDC021019]|uniref:amino acid ABC transporter permease n=1 Tax=Streptomyces sp. NPDC021019 TaxID=3365108 RepID=UPI0037B513A3
MAWDEWEQLKGEVAARHSPRTRLNQAPEAVGGRSGGASDTDRLQHSAKPWSDAAGVADDLQTSTKQVKAKLTGAHEGIANKHVLEHYGLATGTNGFDSFDALQGVLTSWEERLEAIRGECASLGPKLRQAANELSGTDSKVKSTVDSVKLPKSAKGG